MIFDFNNVFDKPPKNNKKRAYTDEDLDHIMYNVRYRDFDKLTELDFIVTMNEEGHITLDIRERHKLDKGKSYLTHHFGKGTACTKTFQIRMNDLSKDFTFRCPIELL